MVEELAAGRTAVENKGNELADADGQKAQAAEDLSDTNAQLETDKSFLADVKSRCAAMDKQFADRTAMRQEETKAVSEALAILQDDDAKDLMSRSTFLQLSAASRASGADVIGTIKESIDALIANLKKEQKDEVEKKDWCRDELHKSDMELEAKYEKKEDIEIIINNHDALVLKLKTEISAATEQIAATKVSTQAANENRVKGNTEYQATANDQKAMQEVLKRALEKLQGFYSKSA